ncbi:MAG: hypothetical protein NWQ16_11995 [Akkermansiaceae bacterium]|nr:hypothetical protein [Akkermansiaceae bacterium]
MKTFLLALTLLLPTFAQEDRIVLIPEKTEKPAPLFFSATASVTATASTTKVSSVQDIIFKIHQGIPETLTLPLTGSGTVEQVTGEGLLDWSVRVAENGSRFLDVRPVISDKKNLPKSLTIQLTTSGDPNSLLLPAPGKTTGFSLTVQLDPASGTELRVTRAPGFFPLESGATRKYTTTTAASLEFATSPAGTASNGLELLDSSLTATLSEDSRSATFTLTATVRADAAGASAMLLSGNAALSGSVSGENHHIALDDGSAYELIADTAGDFPVSIEFVVPITRRGDWYQLGFKLPAGVVVPLTLTGLPQGVSFDNDLPVVPRKGALPLGGESTYRGFLPASGQATLAWKNSTTAETGSLFYTSTATTEIRIGSGLTRQVTALDLRILQGKLPSLSLDLAGPGEILSVTGPSVLAWAVTGENDDRKIEVKLSRPIEGSEQITVEAQTALGGFPVKMQALRITPLGSLRHSGHLRVANDGAVRIELANAKGLIQLTPEQFPGAKDDTLRQVFVYRFPSAEFSYQLLADQILPEVGLTEVTVYELAETDRRIISDIELDIREAPLREWEMQIPADHAVASVTGAEVADYAVASEVKNGLRTLKIIFRQPVINRQLISLRLEKNEAAKAAPWLLQPLAFPDTKSRRGYIGATATAGYRLTPGKTTGLAEVPVTFFPRKTPGLQQSFRIRETTWTATLNIEALGQSIQADVFHLYSLKAGAAYGSVLINYFVVGAPANEWKISVPASIGNIDVTGQNVGRDWRREGDTVIVPLSRPILGAGTLLLTFEQPMPSSGGELSPGEVRPLGVQAERGYIQIVSPLQVKFSAPSSEGPLLKIDATELPAEFRLLSSAPTLAAWQYTARDFKIGANVQWYEQGETVDQVVDFLKLSSQISRDGQWVTDARFFVKSKGRATLRALLPAGTSLWEASVDGTPVNARADGKETLIPLPSTTDPNQAVEISLRYGARSENPKKPTLTAPALDAPLVIGEWTVTGDENRTLVPRGGTADLVRPSLAETGWQWLARHPLAVVLLLFVGAVMLFRNSLPRFVRYATPVIFVILAVLLALKSASSTLQTSPTLEYAAPVVSAAQAITVEISNLTPWQARAGWDAWLLLILGTTITLVGFMKKHFLLKAAGLAFVIASFLSIRGGTPLFFFVLALIAITSIPWRRIASALPKSSKAATTTAILLFTLLSIGQTKAQDFKPAESITQTWIIKENRLQATMDITLRAEKGDRFLILKSPATLTDFQGAQLTTSKSTVDGKDAYFVIAEATGLLTATATYEQRLSATDPWQIPTGSAAMRQITLTYDKPGYEFLSESAAKITPTKANATQSAATLILGPAANPTITASPAQRDISSEETKFFAEVSNLFLPSPGVVNARHHIIIRPSQGRVSELLLKIPTGFTVSEVANGPIGTWRFDPEKQQLRIPVEPAQSAPFAFTVTTQQGTETLPIDLTLAPIRVEATAGEVGFLALAFGNEAQPENITPTNLSRINPEDFNQNLLPKNTLLQHAFRYGKEDASLKVKVTEVAPELRAESWQLVSLGDDRLVISTDLSVNITRSGVFKLALEIPAGLEIEAATGDSLSHWTESTVDKKRIITLHLAGKTIGKRDFNLTLTGRPPGATENWQVPRIILQDASRETGLLTIVPDRGLQVRAVNRKNVSQIDPRELTDTQRESTRAAARPGALAYRLLQSDWALNLAISKLDPWVTAKVFHETTLREGQTLTRAAITYRIENAALKALRIRIPGLDETAASTVRATGDAVADLIPIEDEEGLYEIRFQRGIAGETKVEIEFQQATKDTGTETIQPITLEEVRQLQYFAAVRAGGRLALSTADLPRGWQRADWAVAQAAIGQPAGTTAPLLLFRVADAEAPLTVAIKRHELQDLEKLRVSQGTLTTLISPDGDSLTAVDLQMQVTAKTTLRLKLPAESKLFNVLVNEEGATLVREKGEWLFYVFPSPEPGKPANVRFVYSEKSEDTTLQGPVLNVPMENLTWRVLIPEGFQLASHEGDFDLSEQSSYGSFNLEDYKSLAQSKKQTDAASAMALLDQANSWLAQGDQEKASQLLSNAYNSNQLDAASGEDARVQLRELKTQQAVLGLNTRRQKLAIDNKVAGQDENAQLEQAANANPILKGDSNYDPAQFDRFLEGNSADEISALKEIANRIVTQQLAAEPAPLALDITLPERGQVLTFKRSVQVESQSEAPMQISLDLKKTRKTTSWLAIPLCLLIGAMGATRRRATNSVLPN